MRRWLGAAAACLLAGCALKSPPHPVTLTNPAVGLATAKPTIPTTPPPPIPPQANFLLVVSETVASPDHDIGSYTKVFIDNLPAGETRIAARSVEKTWGVEISTGNHLFRFQKWELPDTGDWTELDPQYQPPERFIRINPGDKTIARLKFYDDALRHSLQIERQPLPAPAQPQPQSQPQP